VTAWTRIGTKARTEASTKVRMRMMVAMRIDVESVLSIYVAIIKK
jgi:hypothetical protein